MQNKRGQGLSTNAIVLIILAVVVLVILIIGFTVGWEKLAPWISGNNVDEIVNQCSVACSTSSVYNFCSKEITLKADDIPGGIKEMKGNCSFFATESDYQKYGVQDCPGLCA